MWRWGEKCRNIGIKKKSLYLLEIFESEKTDHADQKQLQTAACGIDLERFRVTVRKNANFWKSLKDIENSVHGILRWTKGHNISKQQLLTTFFVADMKVWISKNACWFSEQMTVKNDCSWTTSFFRAQTFLPSSKLQYVRLKWRWYTQHKDEKIYISRRKLSGIIKRGKKNRLSSTGWIPTIWSRKSKSTTCIHKLYQFRSLLNNGSNFPIFPWKKFKENSVPRRSGSTHLGAQHIAKGTLSND